VALPWGIKTYVTRQFPIPDYGAASKEPASP
jgi:hypothetical protein